MVVHSLPVARGLEVSPVAGRLNPATDRTSHAAVLRFDPLAVVIADADPNAPRTLMDAHGAQLAQHSDCAVDRAFLHVGVLRSCLASHLQTSE
jgi:hypothetical protein